MIESESCRVLDGCRERRKTGAIAQWLIVGKAHGGVSRFLERQRFSPSRPHSAVATGYSTNTNILMFVLTVLAKG